MQWTKHCKGERGQTDVYTARLLLEELVYPDTITTEVPAAIQWEPPALWLSTLVNILILVHTPCLIEEGTWVSHCLSGLW